MMRLNIYLVNLLRCTYVLLFFSAVVSVKPENAAAAVQAAAATGQPIIQQSAPQNFVYMQQFPQPSYHPQMGQVRQGPEVVKKFSSSTQLSMKLKLLIITEIAKID